MNITVREHGLTLETLDSDARTVRATLVTGRRQTVFSMAEFASVDEILLLDGYEDHGSFVLLDGHPEKYGRVTAEEIIGSVDDVRRVALEDGTDSLNGLVTFDEDEISERVFRKVVRRHLRRVSVGVAPRETHRIAPGDTQQIGAQTFTASQARPLYVTTRFRFIELSTTYFGADIDAKFRSFTGDNPR